MPKLMGKRDWIQTVANVGSAVRVWSENVMSHSGTVSLPVPEGGLYQVIFVKIDADPEAVKPKRKSAREFIGYCRKFNPEYRSTAEIMKELREGEEE